MKTKRKTLINDNNMITGMYYTNPITCNRTTKKGGVKNVSGVNAVYARETSENIRL